MARGQHQKSREGQSVSDDDLARYTAARAFLSGEWFGAIMMVASFTQLYFVVFAGQGDATVALIVGLLLLVFGAFIFWKNRSYYLSLDWPWRRKWEFAATVVAGSGVIFWMLFGILYAMTLAGKPILPE